MIQTCKRCSRSNPPEAIYCYYDGSALPGQARVGTPVAVGAQSFPSPFVFSGGRSCRSFDELALAISQNWGEARELLRKGYLESFLGTLGRMDLVQAAREAARFPDPDRGLDQFLDKLPTNLLDPAKLQVKQAEFNLPTLRVGQSMRLELRLHNAGRRLCHGSMAAADCIWLALGDTGTADKVFQFTDDLVVPVQVQGMRLRASNKPLEGRIAIDSNGGSVSVVVRVEVPVVPFPNGVLAGAVSPRQVAEKAKEKPKEAAPFLENGAVAKWYQDNGWTYPVQVPAASGLGAVQQFFEALGLTPPPKVEISPASISLQGNVGDRLMRTVEIKAQEKRPVWAHAVSDQPWLEVSKAQLEGRTATIPVMVRSIPDQPGQTLQAQLTVTSNGNHRFKVPVTLAVGGTARPGFVPVSPISAAPRASSWAPASTLTAEPPPTVIPVGRAPAASGAGGKILRWLPVCFLGVALLAVLVRDLFFKGTSSTEDVADTGPRIGLRVHDGQHRADGSARDLLDQLLPDASMRFGLVMLKAQQGSKPKRLTFDEFGRTNNTCVKIDEIEALFGDSKVGRWEERGARTWKDEQGREHEGLRSVWVVDGKKVAVVQMVELIPGEQTEVVDTCLVRYVLENRDDRAHTVGLRFMLDTYIGANDGVPFTIPGQSGLCDDQRDFAGAERVPEFIQALENEDLKNPGTVAHLKLKLGGQREPPTRVTLGAWPDSDLKHLLSVNEAAGWDTKWQVPLRPMKTLFPHDSAVVVYWEPKSLDAGQKREVGFTYGLGSVASSGKLLLTVDGSFKPGGDLTVTVLVRDPAAGETVTLVVPDGFKIDGSATQKVPEGGDAASRNRPVTWKVKAGPIGKHNITVRSSTGDEQTQRITIREKGIFD